MAAKPARAVAARQGLRGQIRRFSSSFASLSRPSTPISSASRFRTSDPIDRTVIAEGRTSQKLYVSADVGLLYAGTIDIGAVYVGTNVYFRPINKDASFREASSLGRRLALTIGITLSSVGDENNQTRSDLFWHQSLVLGAGYRLTPSIRVGGGALIFRESDPNPLITRKTAAATWYASFSFDVDMAGYFASRSRREEIP